MANLDFQKKLLRAQKAELTEHHIYTNLARREATPSNREILEKIAQDELRHHDVLKTHTKETVTPDRLKIAVYQVLAWILGITFTLRLMESKEDLAQKSYRQATSNVPGLAALEKDEYRHEQALIGMLDEERLRYASSVVLGLNDALVELTGALAGFTLALQNTRLIALVGLVTGISASFSMAASEYLSTKTEEDSGKSPLKAAVYTGIAYVLAVAVLILPYLLLTNHFTALGWTLVNALLLILVFTYYLSVSRNTPFTKSYLEMAGISMGVAAISFGLGFAIKSVLGVDL
jgi:VIT1/CCC1 family predicted Fe2+/Mn2+ transporter